MTGTTGQGLEQILDTVVTADSVTAARIRRWAQRLDEVDPGEAGAVDRVVRAARAVRQRHGLTQGARVLAGALDQPAWPSADRLASGLAARRLAADLTLGTATTEADREVAVRGALAGADEALRGGARTEALDRLGDAMTLLFHRELHAETEMSALVEDPQGYLAPLLGSRTWRELVVPRHPDGAPPTHARDAPHEGHAGPARRVLVATGAYGNFHGPVVQALREAASAPEVRVADLTELIPSLGRKIMDTQVLPDLAALLEGRPSDAPAVARLRELLGWADVVLCDWADRSTLWVSHLAPPGTRMVLRVHGLDLVDPWMPLLRWDRVEVVLTTSPPMRSLTRSVAAAAAAGSGAPIPPVRVIDNLVPLREMARPKSPGARTTLGMVGWGRIVKDPAWTLDLLDREPSWRLVLIGPDFAQRPTPAQAAYVEAFRERIAAPGLRDRVHVVGRTEDVAGALQQVGVIVSSSRREGWHLGLVEGAASGAVPVVRNWPMVASRGGPRALFPDEWVVDDLDAAEARIRAVTEPGAWPGLGARAQQQADALFDPARVADRYRSVVLG
ncbi:glycosyltransferase family 4 protein [Serinicoccus kebangsaanensis]|uniref:glycosyltransferase family 4 protein n=1 Tax=Serinicoccus kebangsaanensis TaxID=2602069 RepID=UPI00124C794A|nr:glycosyltransferase family 4 protein [Serinicoccus kebangsaanensis]